MNSYTQPVGAIEKIYAFVGLSLVVGVFMPLFIQGGWFVSKQIHEGGIQFQIISGSIYLISAVILLSHQKETIGFIKNNSVLFLFIIFILLSGFWAELPQVSLRRSIALLGTTIFGTYLALRFQPSEFYRLLALVFMLLALESLLLAVFVPHIGTEPYFDGAWRGALGFKNDFGRIMVLSATLFWLLSNKADHLRFVYLGFFALSVFLVIMSQSRSAWVVSFFLLFLIPILIYMQNSSRTFILRALVVIVLCAIIVTLFLLPNLDEFLALINRDTTLTGRTTIWLSAINIGIERPWLGSGYRSFWTESVRGFLILAGHGHNSFLDMWLELGFVGLALFVTTLVIALNQAVMQMKRSSGRKAIWPVIFLVYLLMYCMVAKVLPDHGTITWVLYVVSLLFLSSASTSKQTQNIPAPVESG